MLTFRQNNLSYAQCLPCIDINEVLEFLNKINFYMCRLITALEKLYDLSFKERLHNQLASGVHETVTC
jgi:hypothetical protein